MPAGMPMLTDSTFMFLRNLLLMSFILSPALILFGMIIFAGKPKDQIKTAEALSDEEETDER